MKILPMRTKDEWDWLYARATPTWTPRSRGIVALEKDGTIAAAAVFDSWTKTSCQAHIAIENPLAIKYGFLHECLTYVFVDSGRRIIVGLTPSTNEKSLRFNKKMGFEVVHRMKDGWDEGVDYVVQELHKRNAGRWIYERRTRAA